MRGWLHRKVKSLIPSCTVVCWDVASSQFPEFVIVVIPCSVTPAGERYGDRELWGHPMRQRCCLGSCCEELAHSGMSANTSPVQWKGPPQREGHQSGDGGLPGGGAGHACVAGMLGTTVLPIVGYLNWSEELSSSPTVRLVFVLTALTSGQKLCPRKAGMVFQGTHSRLMESRAVLLEPSSPA